MDTNRLNELIATAVDKSKSVNDSGDKTKVLEKTDSEKAMELKESFAELRSEIGTDSAAYVVANIVYRRLMDEAPFQDLTGILMPYDGMYEFTEQPVYQREGEPTLYWLGDETDHIEMFTTKVSTEEFTLNFDSIYAAFSFNVDLLASGKFYDFQSQVNKARKQFVGAANMLMWSAIRDSFKAGTHANSATGTLSISALDTAIKWVEDNSEEGPKAFFGRTTTLMDAANLSSASLTDHLPEFVKEESFRSMHIKGYKDVPLVGVRKQIVRTSKSQIIGAGVGGSDAIPAGEVILIPYDTFGIFAEQGPIQVMETRDALTRKVSYSMGRRMGCAVWESGRPCYLYVAT